MSAPASSSAGLPEGARVVLATHNAGKVREIADLLGPHGVETVSAAELGLPEPEETGTTFIANAELKARAAADASGLPALADDSGLSVDALGGNPRLVVDGAVSGPEVDGAGDFFGRHGRTAVGVTADGRLLLVVVDGRQPGYSRGMTLRELAELLQRLGQARGVGRGHPAAGDGERDRQGRPGAQPARGATPESA